MRIAIDFDQTFTADPYLWDHFIRNALHRGHEVRVVTARDGINDGIKWTRVAGYASAPCDIIWCDGRPKREVCRAEGWEPDIWIDDNPAGIVFASSFKDEETLASWRSQDEYRASTQPIHGRSRGFEYKKDKANDGERGLSGVPGTSAEERSGQGLGGRLRASAAGGMGANAGGGEASNRPGYAPRTGLKRAHRA